MSLIARLQERAGNIGRATDMTQLVIPTVLPPVDRTIVEHTEATLNFRLPELLRQIYTEVGNGGLGPGYGLWDIESLVRMYPHCHESNPYQPNELWPKGMLDICEWGCGITGCIDCSNAEAPVYMFEADPTTEENEAGDEIWVALEGFELHRPSFENWMEAWLDGVDLWAELRGPTRRRA